MDFDHKIAFGVSAMILLAIGYVPYFRDIFLGKTKPHLYSWFLSAFAGAFIFILQLNNGGGIGAWVTLFSTIVSGAIGILAIKFGATDIKKADLYFAGLSLLSLFFWLYLSSPYIAIVLLVSQGFFAFLPTIRKSWNDPASETLFSYVVHVVRHGFAALALKELNFVSALSPIFWVGINILFVAMLWYRRKVIN